MSDQIYTTTVPISRDLAEYMDANPGVVEAYIQAKVTERFYKEVKEMTDAWLLGDGK